MSDTTPGAGGPGATSGDMREPAHAPVPPQAVTGQARTRGEGRGGIVAGSILIVLGAIFLIGQFVPDLGIEKLWPLVLIVIGLAVMFRRR